MSGTARRTVESEQSTSLEDAVDDRRGEVVVVQHVAPVVGVLVRGEDHRASADVPFVDDVEQRVRGVVGMREVADLVDDEHVGLQVRREHGLAHAVARRGRDVVDERGGVDEERVESVLDRAVREGDGEVRLPASRLAVEDERTAFGDEVVREERTEHGGAQRRLQAEVELVDRLEEREGRGAGLPVQPSAAPVRDLLLDERAQERLVSEVLLLCALHEIAPDAARVGEVKALENYVQRGRLAIGHRSPPRRRARTSPRGKRPSWPRACAPRAAPEGRGDCGAHTSCSTCC